MLQTFGLKYTSAGNSGFLTGLYIVLVPLISAAIYRRWPQIPELLGISVATVGMVLLTLPSLERQFHLEPRRLADHWLRRGFCLPPAGPRLLFAARTLRSGRFRPNPLRCRSVHHFAREWNIRAQCGARSVLFAILVTSVFATAHRFRATNLGAAIHHRDADRAGFCVGACFRARHRGPGGRRKAHGARSAGRGFDSDRHFGRRNETCACRMTSEVATADAFVLFYQREGGQVLYTG